MPKKIPPKLTEIPHWLVPGSTKDEKQIADDLTSIAYWSGVYQKAKFQVLQEIKKEPGWVVTKPLEKQIPELRLKYAEMLDIAKEKLEKSFDRDVYARARQVAEASDASYDNAGDLAAVMERVQQRIALNIEEQGLLRLLEHDNIFEFISSKSKWDGVGPKPSIEYERDFIATYLIPMLKANGFPIDVFLGIDENFQKARFATYYIRNQVRDVMHKVDRIRTAMTETNDEDEKGHLEEALSEAFKMDTRLHETLDALIHEMSLSSKQGGMTVAEFRKKLSEISNRKKENPDPVIGYVTYMKQGGILQISVEDNAMLKAIMRNCNGLVDWHDGDPITMAKQAAEIILKNSVGENVVNI